MFSFRNSYILIAVLCVIVYANTLQHGFVLDDTAVIENNRFVKAGVSGIPDILTTFYWEGFWNSNSGLYRPLSLVSFAVEYQLSPNNPFIHHLFNVLYYTIACCLLFEFLCKIFNKADPRFFLLAVLLFVVHPIHTEVVANIKSRDEIFSLLFFLLSCRQFYVLVGNDKKRMFLGSFFFLLSLLSKEGAIAFLPVIFLLDYREEKRIPALLRQRAVLLVTTVVWFAWHQYVILSSSSPQIVYTYDDNSLFASSSVLEQRATALGMFARYVIKSFYPYQLSYDYSFSQIPMVGLISLPAMAGLLIFFGCIYLGFIYFKKDPLITFCVAMIVLPLLLTGNLIFNIGATMADRFLFIPTIGSCILICYLIFKLFKALPSQKVFPPTVRYVLVLLIVLFSFRSFTRNKDWKSNDTLFSHDVAVVPNSARAHYNNAIVLQNHSGSVISEASRKEYEVCLGIDPEKVDALINLGVLYGKQKEYDKALGLYRRALHKDKNNSDVMGNMGDVFYKSGQIDSSIIYLKKAHLAGNTNPESYNILGTALFGKQNYAEAQAAFETGLKSDTTNWSLYLNYGNVLATTSKFDEALNAFQHAYRLNRSNPQPPYFLAMTYSKLGDTLNANKYYNEYKNLNK